MLKNFIDRIGQYNLGITAGLGLFSLLTATFPAAVQKALETTQIQVLVACSRYVPLVFLIFALVVFLRAWLLARPTVSILKKPDAFVLRRDNAEHLVGRAEDIDAVIAKVVRGRLVFVEGDSGVGKSALLGVGVTHKLREGGRMPPIYIESIAGTDWDEDAWRALFVVLSSMLIAEQRKAIGLAGLPKPDQREAVFDAALALLEGEPLVIIDQFDDYQQRHADRFIPQGSWIKPRGLAKNTFWAKLRAAMAAGQLRLLIVTRTDTALGLESVRFVQPETYRVQRLPVKYIRQLLDNVAQPAGADAAPLIENPEAGWTELKERLIRDLAGSGAILPQQMKVALLGLALLPGQILSVEAYARAGGVRGIEAGWIEAEINDAATDGGLTKEQIVALLERLIDPAAPTKTRDVAASDLLAGLGLTQADGARMTQSLAALEQGEVVRAGAPQAGGAVWRLDHDYLAGVVRAMTQRANRWALALKAGQDAWTEASGPMAKWSALMRQHVQLGFGWDRLKGRFRYGPARNYALTSLLRFAPLVLVLVTTGVLATQLVAREQATARGQEIAQVFDGVASLTPHERRRLAELSLAPKAVQKRVVQAMIQDSTMAVRFNVHSTSILNALDLASGGDWGSLTGVVRGIQDDADLDPAQIVAIAKVWDRAGNPDIAAKLLGDAIAARSDDPKALQTLVFGMGGVDDTPPYATARKVAAEALIRAMTENKSNDDLLNSLGGALSSLDGQVSPSMQGDAQALADHILFRLGEGANFDFSQLRLGITLVPVVSQLPAPAVREAMERYLAGPARRGIGNLVAGPSLAGVVADLPDTDRALIADATLKAIVEGESTWEGSLVKNYMKALRVTLSKDQAKFLVDSIDDGTEFSLFTKMTSYSAPFSQFKLSAGAQSYALAFGDKMLAKMRNGSSDLMFSEAATALADVESQLPVALARNQAEEGAWLIMARLRETGREDYRSQIATPLVELAVKLSPEVAQDLGEELIPVMKARRKHLQDLTSLATALSALDVKLSSSQVQEVSALLIAALAEADSLNEREETAKALGEFGAARPAAQAQLVADLILKEMSARVDEPDHFASLGAAFEVMSDRMPRGATQAYAKQLALWLGKAPDGVFAESLHPARIGLAAPAPPEPRIRLALVALRDPWLTSKSEYKVQKRLEPIAGRKFEDDDDPRAPDAWLTNARAEGRFKAVTDAQVREDLRGLMRERLARPAVEARKNGTKAK